MYSNIYFFYRFASLGVEVAFTEVDVRIRLPSNQNTLQQQAKDYTTVLTACEAVKSCISFTIWGMSDKYSWVPSTFQGFGDALLWDKNFSTKPAYKAVEAVLH